MTIIVAHGEARLSGLCTAEDAEPLLEFFAAGGDRVDLGKCEHLHAAVLQLLLAARPGITGTPAPFVREWIVPFLASSGKAPPQAA